MAIDLSGLTAVQLIEEHNRLVDQKDHLTRWKGAKDALAAKVATLRGEEKKKRHVVARTIKQAAYEHLLSVEVKDHTGRDIGFSYEEILGRLRDEFPDCDTTDKCLRWYAVQLNTDGAKLPWRPRKPPKRRKKDGPKPDADRGVQPPQGRDSAHRRDGEGDQAAPAARPR